MYIYIYIYITCGRRGAVNAPGDPKGGLSEVRPVRLLRVWISEGLTQADS